MPTLAEQLAQRAVARRSATYADEVQRLIDAGRDLMIAAGTARPPRVADIVARAGSSNDAFYRHFPTKGALVAAVVQDGALRLRERLAHRMVKEAEPAAQVRQWVRGMLAQAEGEVAQHTRAILWNAPELMDTPGIERTVAISLGQLLEEPLRALGAPRPDLLAALAGHGVMGLLGQHVRASTVASRKEIELVGAIWVDAATAAAVSTG